MNDSYTLSIVVPTYNRGELLKKSIDCALNQDCSDYEVIYVDDGSTDETPRILEEYASRHGDRFRFLRLPNGGPGPARNAGVDVASGKLILLTDDDTEPPRNWASGMIERRNHHGCDVLSGGFTPASTATPVERYLHYRMRILFDDTPKPIRAAPMMNFLVPKALYLEAGGFPTERLPAAEDWEFCYRLKETGATLFYDPAISVAHHYQRDALAALKRMREAGACGLHVTQGRRNLSLYALYSVAKFVSSPLWIPRKFPLALYPLALRMEAAFCSARLRAYLGVLHGRRVLS